MPNRLAQSPSNYLLQHKDNPVDWYPWCDEAWEKARAEQKPVFLSIGYSSCHWCHVMAHESFEDEQIAKQLNENFVSIKLDREERPDIDEIYMTAVQLANGHGGWPMSIFLTPDKKPFFAGTYFPKQARGEFPGFLTLVGSLAKAWSESHKEILQAAEEFSDAIRGALERTLPSETKVIGVEILDKAVEELHLAFDFDNGGFGHSPKFPPHSAIRFLLDYASIRSDFDNLAEDLVSRAGHMALFTLEKIALGGICDHVGGGFHRYSTDEKWLLPHFEKMLSDNAQLLASFIHASHVSTDDRLTRLFTRTASSIVTWISECLTLESGTFMSSMNADSCGVEGAYYVWTLEDINQLVNDEGFAKDFRIEAPGNFYEEFSGQRTGENVLHLGRDVEGKWDAKLQTLKMKRLARVPPTIDDKSIAAWSGLVISVCCCRQFGDGNKGC